MITVLAIGREVTIKKVAHALAEKNVEVISLTGGVFNLESLERRKQIDVVVVDNSCEWRERAFWFASVVGDLWDARVLLLFDPVQTDWDRTASMNPDGYIPATARNDELLARLQAALKRARRAQPSGREA